MNTLVLALTCEVQPLDYGGALEDVLLGNERKRDGKDQLKGSKNTEAVGESCRKTELGSPFQPLATRAVKSLHGITK